ncbi:hypothetical protein ACSHT0_08080 [Tepidicaulis sp. LMO-SS28]|uniref:hypothetical protein n=1 Tax=Tepidicaulis sp. LMO-SS28 TaxID=3447455 RepID=UPI003EE11D32
MKLWHAAALALSLALTPIASAVADVYLTGEEVAKIVAGNTIQGQYRECAAARKDFVEFYAEDGTIRGKERACNQAGTWTRYQGTWEVKDGKFCVQLGHSDRSDGCFDYEADEESTLRRVNEPGIGNTNFQIFDGNPENL